MGGKCISAGLVILSAVSMAWGHEGDDALSAWYRSLKTVNGGSCCNMTDCQVTDARIVGGHWEVPSERIITTLPPQIEWEAVPVDVVLKRENEAGRAVVCRFGGRILCFVPPSET